MHNEKLTQIILLHSSRFVCEGFKKFGAAQNISVFYLTAPEPLEYLVEDLGPQLVLVEASLLAGLRAELDEINGDSVKVLSIGKDESFLSLDTPLDLSKVFSDLEDLLASSLKSH